MRDFIEKVDLLGSLIDRDTNEGCFSREPARVMVVSDDLKTMSDGAKEARFKSRKRSDDFVATEDIEDDIDFGKYL